MKKIKYLFLVLATVCFIGLYGCKSTPKEEKVAEEVETVEEAVEEVVADSTIVVEAEEAEAVEEEK
jgi:outer membrane murein-binding lipoprotein Lpp